MRKKGASLIWALVMSTTLLFVTTTFANVIIAESQMSIRMDDSSRAYAAAESGIEWGKYCLTTKSSCNNGTYGPFSVLYSPSGIATYRVTISGGNTIESIGTINNVNRKLEYTVSSANNLTFRAPTSTFTSTGSYSMQFDYWTDGTKPSSNVIIGMADASNTYGIYFLQSASTGNLYLGIKNTSGFAWTPYASNAFYAYGNPSLSGPYAIRVELEYTENLYANMTVSIRNSGTGEYACAATAVAVSNYVLTYQLASVSDFNDSFTHFSFYSGASSVTPTQITTEGDGSVFRVGAAAAYFDNLATSGF